MSANTVLISHDSGNLLMNSLTLLTPQEVLGTTRVSKGWKKIVDDGLAPKEKLAHPLKVHAIWIEVNKMNYNAIRDLKTVRETLKSRVGELKGAQKKGVGKEILKIIACGAGVLALGILFGRNGVTVGMFLGALVNNGRFFNSGDFDRCEKLKGEIDRGENSLALLGQEIASKKKKIITMEQIKLQMAEGFTSPELIRLMVKLDRIDAYVISTHM